MQADQDRTGIDGDDARPYYARPSARPARHAVPSPEEALRTGFPFRARFERGKAIVSTFRSGRVRVSGFGLVIEGLAAPASRFLVPLPIPYVHQLVLLVRLIMQFVRVRRTLEVPWRSVRQVILVPDRQRLCLVYEALDVRGGVRLFSLAFQLAPPLYDAFVKAVTRHVPERVAPGKLRWGVSPLAAFGLILAAAALLIACSVYSSAPGR